MAKHTGSRQALIIDRLVHPEGIIRAKKKVFWDPLGRLIPMAGKAVKMENPLNHPGPFYVVYDVHMFMITRVRSLENEDIAEVGRQMERFLRCGHVTTAPQINGGTGEDG